MKRNTIVASVVCVSVVMVFAFSGVSNSQTERKAREVLGSKGYHITVLDKETQKTIIGGFKSLSGMESETEVIEYRDGNDEQAVRKIPGRTKYSNITLKRGIISNTDLWDWKEQVISGETGFQKNLIITVFDRANDVVAQWEVTNAWPSKISCSIEEDDNTNNTGMAIEKLELAVEKIERVLR